MGKTVDKLVSGIIGAVVGSVLTVAALNPEKIYIPKRIMGTVTEEWQSVYGPSNRPFRAYRIATNSAEHVAIIEGRGYDPLNVDDKVSFRLGERTVFSPGHKYREVDGRFVKPDQWGYILEEFKKQ